MRRDNGSAASASGTNSGQQPMIHSQGRLPNSSVSKLQDFLHQNFTRKLAIAEMAAICGLSPHHFVRAFSRTFGMPPHQYVLDLRLDFAEKLLADSQITIADIAHLAGFSTQSHFTAVMKKSRQVTPLQARMGKLNAKLK